MSEKSELEPELVRFSNSSCGSCKIQQNGSGCTLYDVQLLYSIVQLTGSNLAKVEDLLTILVKFGTNRTTDAQTDTEILGGICRVASTTKNKYKRCFFYFYVNIVLIGYYKKKMWVAKVLWGSECIYLLTFMVKKGRSKRWLRISYVKFNPIPHVIFVCVCCLE